MVEGDHVRLVLVIRAARVHEPILYPRFPCRHDVEAAVGPLPAFAWAEYLSATLSLLVHRESVSQNWKEKGDEAEVSQWTYRSYLVSIWRGESYRFGLYIDTDDQKRFSGMDAIYIPT